jgi:hypothetical protein
MFITETVRMHLVLTACSTLHLVPTWQPLIKVLIFHFSDVWQPTAPSQHPGKNGRQECPHTFSTLVQGCGCSVHGCLLLIDCQQARKWLHSHMLVCRTSASQSVGYQFDRDRISYYAFQIGQLCRIGFSNDLLAL